MTTDNAVAHIGKPDPCNRDRGQARYAYCGRYVFYEFSFLGIEHAERSITTGTRVRPCEHCLAKARGQSA